MAICLLSIICPSCRLFFQAEDGIRDVAVTGVQTCALPICRAPEIADDDPFRRRRFQELDDLASFELVHFTGEAYQDLARYPTNCGPNSGNFWRGLLGLGVGDVRRHARNRHHQMKVAAEGVDAPHVPSEKRRALGVREIESVERPFGAGVEARSQGAGFLQAVQEAVGLGSAAPTLRSTAARLIRPSSPK